MDVSGRKEAIFYVMLEIWGEILFALNLECKWMASKDDFFL